MRGVLRTRSPARSLPPQELRALKSLHEIRLPTGACLHALSARTRHLLDPTTAGSVNPAHVLLVNSMSMFMCAFMAACINVALPSMQNELRLGAASLGWISLSYMLSSAALLIPFGKVADIYGRRLIYLTGMSLFVITSLALAFAGSYVLLIGLRLVQGVGASMMFASSNAMVALAYPPGSRGKAMGILVGTVYIGQTMGPVLGGVLTYNLGWRSIFVFAAAYGALNLVLDVSLLRRTEWREKPTHFDWPGSLVYMVSVSCLLAGLSWLPQTVGVVLLTAGVVGLASFAWWETRARVPVLEVSLFARNRAFALSNLAGMASYAAIAAMTLLMSLYLQYIKGLDAQTAGFLLVAGVIFQAAFSPLAGRLSDRVDPRWVASGGMALCAVGLLSFSLLTDHTPYWLIIVTLIVLGLGYAFFSSPNQNSIMCSVRRRNVGTASAVLGTARQIGQALSVAVATLVMAVIIGRHDIMPADYPNLLTSIRTSFAILTAICVFAILSSLARGSGPPPDDEEA
jgi:EmrB/QacA subfamily drug resistance transporter